MRAISILTMACCSVLLGDSRLTGRVADDGGGAIGEATLIIRWDSAGSQVGLSSNVGIKKDLILKTNTEGVFEALLPSGFYDVFVSATAFRPMCRKVRINEGTVASLKFKLRLDPLVILELGDRIGFKH